MNGLHLFKAHLFEENVLRRDLKSHPRSSQNCIENGSGLIKKKKPTSLHLPLIIPGMHEHTYHQRALNPAQVSAGRLKLKMVELMPLNCQSRVSDCPKQEIESEIQGWEFYSLHYLILLRYIASFTDAVHRCSLSMKHTESEFVSTSFNISSVSDASRSLKTSLVPQTC